MTFESMMSLLPNLCNISVLNTHTSNTAEVQQKVFHTLQIYAVSSPPPEATMVASAEFHATANTASARKSQLVNQML